jgi:hypothetical protein
MQRALIDLTDVCGRSGSFDPYVAVRAAVRQRGLEVRALADTTVRTQLGPDDLAHLDAAVRRDEVELVPDAAPHLLERLATDTDTVLVSNRRFRSLRSTFPSLDGVERVLRHDLTTGRAELIPAPFDRLGELEVSTAARLRRLAAAGHRSASDHDLLLHDWRCRTRGCVGAASAPQLELPPHVLGGAAVCPVCEQVLVRLGPVSAGIELTLGVAGTVRQRIVIAQRSASTLGRGAGPADLDVQHLLSDDDGALLVAREHLVVTNHDGRLRVRDAGSSAGSRLRSPDGRVIDLEPGTTTVVETGATVTLGGVLEVTPVPRRWTWATTLHPGVAPAGADHPDVGTVTVRAVRS